MLVVISLHRSGTRDTFRKRLLQFLGKSGPSSLGNDTKSEDGAAPGDGKIAAAAGDIKVCMNDHV